MKKDGTELNILDTPEIVKIEHRYQLVRTALNILAITLMVFVLFRLNNLASQNRVTLNHVDHNQETLLCIVRESTNPVHTKVAIVNGQFQYSVDNSYIDKCVKENS